MVSQLYYCKPLYNPYVDIRDRKSLQKLSRTVMTDSDGRFGFPNLTPGKYELLVWDAEAGYGNPGFGFYESPEGQGADIEIGADDPNKIVTIRLPRQGGVLLVRIRSGSDRKAVGGAFVRLELKSNPHLWMQMAADLSGNLVVAMPGKAVVIRANAPGYSEQKTELPVLAPGEHKTLDVLLQK